MNSRAFSSLKPKLPTSSKYHEIRFVKISSETRPHTCIFIILKHVTTDVYEIIVIHCQIVDHHDNVDDTIIAVDKNIPETSPRGRTPLSEAPLFRDIQVYFVDTVFLCNIFWK